MRYQAAVRCGVAGDQRLVFGHEDPVRLLDDDQIAAPTREVALACAALRRLRELPDRAARPACARRSLPSRRLRRQHLILAADRDRLRCDRTPIRK
jgi:hypothetical protein